MLETDLASVLFLLLGEENLVTRRGSMSCDNVYNEWNDLQARVITQPCGDLRCPDEQESSQTCSTQL